MDKFKGQSIEEVLRKQIQKGELFDNGESGLKPPGGGGDGGGGDGSPDGTGGFEDDDDHQVIFATGALIFLVHSLSLYIYMYTLCSTYGQVLSGINQAQKGLHSF